MKTRTILIGLDGATFSVLDPLMRDGVMPFLKEFVTSGVRAELLSVVPPLTPPAWTSMVTGRSPGHHGIFDFFSKEEGSHHIRLANFNDICSETIWSIVSRQGMRAAALNFPLMWPPPAIHGNVVSGWMPWRQLRFGCYPDDLYDTLKKAVPDFDARKLAMDMSHEEKAIEGCRHEEYHDWIELHIHREKQWFNIFSYLERKDPCDLTAILFDGIDKLQHLCWRFLDPKHLGKKPSSWEKKILSLLLDYFRELDQLLAEIADLAGPDATIVMASDHGFGAQHETFFVNTWLEQNGYLTWADKNAPKETESSVLGIGQLARHVSILDWEQTLAYASTPSSNGIHIVRSNSSHEKGVRKKDYEQFRSRLMVSLYSLKSPSTGEPVVKHIWTREEAFDGPYRDLAPDLTLNLRDGGLLSILSSDKPVKPRNEPSGTHRPEGVLIAGGPGVRRGITLDLISILDVAPTLLYTLGLSVPEDMEGRVIRDLFEPTALRRHPVQVSGASEPVRSHRKSCKDKRGFDDAVETEVAARLRALGYLD